MYIATICPACPMYCTHCGVLPKFKSSFGPYFKLIFQTREALVDIHHCVSGATSANGISKLSESVYNRAMAAV